MDWFFLFENNIVFIWWIEKDLLYLLKQLNIMENIIENNKLIAEFMGINYEPNRNSHESSEYFYEDCELEYHTSWDWLMPVVVKITESEEFCNDYPDKGSFWDAYSSVDKNRVYEAVVKYIKWYNENQSN